MAFFQFDATKVAPNSGFAPIPPGDYLAHMVESSLEDLRSGNGKGLKLTWEVLDGPHKGAKVFDTLNVLHDQEKTRGIAQGHFSAICHSVNVMHPNDTNELHFKPMVISLVIKDDNPKYPPKNEVKAYKPATMNAPVAQVPATSTPGPQHTTANSNAPAWARKG